MYYELGIIISYPHCRPGGGILGISGILELVFEAPLGQQLSDGAHLKTIPQSILWHTALAKYMTAPLETNMN